MRLAVSVCEEDSGGDLGSFAGSPRKRGGASPGCPSDSNLCTGAGVSPWGEAACLASSRSGSVICMTSSFASLQQPP